MTHQDAEKGEATARYLLGEMSGDEREAFEEHLFACPECARIVQADLILRTRRPAAGRPEMEEKEDEGERIRSTSAGLLQWVSLHPRISAVSILAAALALPWLAYREFVALPRLQQEIARWTAPQPLPYHQLEGLTRGSNIVKLRTGCRLAGLWFEMGDRYRYSAFRCDIESQTGKQLSVSDLTPDGLTMRMLVPCQDLPAGDYVLTLYGVREGGDEALETFEFKVQLE